MKRCKKSLGKTRKGKRRGFCTKALGHGGPHTNARCPGCGVIRTKDNCTEFTLQEGLSCRKCTTEDARQRRKCKPRNYQKPGKKHRFLCGCEGLLPRQRGQSNLFARGMGKNWYCRISAILQASNALARRKNYAPIDLQTPHIYIRELMKESYCKLCKQPLKWVFGHGKTPHLHHNHVTGKIYGFVHNLCNLNALEKIVDNLNAEVTALKNEIRILKEGVNEI